MQFNWIDWMVVLVGIYFVWEGWLVGLVKQILSLGSFLGSLWVALIFHSKMAGFLTEKFGIAEVWGETLGYLVTGIVAEFVLAEFVVQILAKMPDKWWKSRANRVLGSIVSALQAGVIMTFVLLVILALPVKGSVKQDIGNSVLGSRLIKVGEMYGGEVKSSLEKATKEAVRFLTVTPDSSERVALPVETGKCSLRNDEVAEAKMLEMVNFERVKTGAKLLVVDTKIVPVARAHAWDMFERHYFSHVSPEGKDAADRMTTAGVKFTLAGENLAYAGDVETAHIGLMDSPGHKRNILEKRFGRVGIGVINGGICGMMFTQNFAN